MAFLSFPSPTQLRNLSDPSSNTDAATKQYVDAALSGGTGTIVVANVTATGEISANTVVANSANLGNTVDANYFIGDGLYLSNIPGSNVTGQVANALVAGTVYTNAQPNITSVGTLTSLTVSGNVTAGNIKTDHLLYANGTAYTLASFTNDGGYLTSADMSSYATQTDVSNAVANLVASAPAALDTLNELANALGNDASFSTTLTNSLANKLSTSSFNSTANTWIATQSTSNLTEGTNLYFTESRANSAIDARVTKSFVDNLSITNIGTLTSLTVEGITDLGDVGNIRIAGGNANFILTTDGSGNLSWVAPSSSAGSLTADVDSFTGNGVQTAFTLTNAPQGANYSIVAVQGIVQPKSAYTISGSTLTFSEAPGDTADIEVTTFGGNVSSGGSSNVAVTVSGNAQPNITSVGTLTSLSVGDISITGNILPTANITYNLGSPTARFKDIYLSGTTIDLAGATIKTDAATGAIALIPQPTVAVPNPIGIVITTSGTLATVTTTAGEANVSHISNAVNNSANFASTDYVDSAVANLVNSAPSALNTLNELATALGNDASFSTTVTNSLANKLNSNAFTYANITGKPTLGNISTVNLDGNASNILYGNGTFAAVPAQGVTLNAYSNSSVFPSSNDGAMAFALDTAVLYIRNSNAWVAVKSANPQYITLNQPGPITTPVTGTARYYPKGNITISNVYAYLGTPSSSNLTFNLYKNGSNVGLFTVSANAYVMSTASTNITMTSSDYLTLGVATGTGATDLKVDLEYK
jgi:hypothetical protein